VVKYNLFQLLVNFLLLAQDDVSLAFDGDDSSLEFCRMSDKISTVLGTSELNDLA